MTVLPIVGRELRVASRKPATYWMRVIVALVAIVIFTWMIWTMSQENVPPTARGRFLFRSLFGVAFFFCLFIGARVTADSLSEEKREGTLGLLFLTDLKGHDVILGKLAAASVNVFYGLLATIPVIALSTQLGGVTAGELFRAPLVLLNTLLFSLAAGIFVSTLSRNERKAMFATIFVILMTAFGPFLLAAILAISFPDAFGSEKALMPILVLSPGYPFASLLFSGLPVPLFTSASFWESSGIVFLTGGILLCAASGILPRIWQARDGNSKLERHRARIEQWSYGASAERRSHRARLLNINPFLWLVGRERWKRYYVWLYLAAVSATWLWGWSQYRDVMFDRKTLLPGVLLFQVFLKIWVISEACNRLAEDRRSGALELLLSTPLTTRDILHGQWLALRQQFARPLLAVMFVEFLVLCRGFSLEMILVNFAMLCADIITLGWVGMWLGLTARNTSRAILGAVGRVLILPWGIYYAGKVSAGLLVGFWMSRPFEPSGRVLIYSWFAIGLGVNLLAGFVWARRNLVANFRAVAVQRFEPEERTWLIRIFQRKQPAPAGSLAAVSGG